MDSNTLLTEKEILMMYKRATPRMLLRWKISNALTPQNKKSRCYLRSDVERLLAQEAILVKSKL